MKMAKARKKTKDPKMIQHNFIGVKNGLKHLICASIRVLVRKVQHTDVEYTLTKHDMKVV